VPVFGVLTIRRVANELVTCLLCFGIALALAQSWWAPFLHCHDREGRLLRFLRLWLEDVHGRQL
jgi:hypothetical protein